jgi:antitoxin VapB
VKQSFGARVPKETLGTRSTTFSLNGRLFLKRRRWRKLHGDVPETKPMIAIAKINATDHSQTVRLPAGFELAGNEVWVRKDETTGEVILSPTSPAPNRHRLQDLFNLLDEAPLPEDFLADRPNPVEVPRNPLDDWSE